MQWKLSDKQAAYREALRGWLTKVAGAHGPGLAGRRRLRFVRDAVRRGPSAHRVSAGQFMLLPPLTLRICPVMKPESSRARNATAAATSSASAPRPTGIKAIASSTTFARRSGARPLASAASSSLVRV